METNTLQSHHFNVYPKMPLISMCPQCKDKDNKEELNFDCLDCAKLLIRNGNLPEIFTAISSKDYITQRNLPDIIPKYLKLKDTFVSDRDQESGHTLMHLSVLGSPTFSLECMRSLVTKLMDNNGRESLSVRDNLSHMRPIDMACRFKMNDVFDELIPYMTKKEINSKCCEQHGGSILLHNAVEFVNVHAVKVLLTEAGADCNILDSNNNSALSKLIKNGFPNFKGRFKIVQYFGEIGCQEAIIVLSRYKDSIKNRNKPTDELESIEQSILSSQEQDQNRADSETQVREIEQSKYQIPLEEYVGTAQKRRMFDSTVSDLWLDENEDNECGAVGRGDNTADPVNSEGDNDIIRMEIGATNSIETLEESVHFMVLSEEPIVGDGVITSNGFVCLS